MTALRSAAVVGAGLSGVAAAESLVALGYQTTVYDQNPEVTVGTASEQIRLQTDKQAERLAARLVADSPSLVVVSPGVPPHSPLVRLAIEAGLEVIGEAELAWRINGDTDWLCITGTNGKTTTVEMLASILRAAGHDVEAAGNVGRPLTRASVPQVRFLPVELSSAQLATASTLRPAASICLNIDSDHLDWHGSEKAYWEAKASVYDRTAIARFYFDDEPETKMMAEQARCAGHSALVPITFGTVPPGSIGVERRKLVVNWGNRPNGRNELALADIPLFAVGVKEGDGRSSPIVRDGVAAAALALAVGIPLERVENGLRNFRPQKHRFNSVGHYLGCHWVNDSKATNPHAAKAALDALPDGKIVWVVGGDTKGNDLSTLVEEVASRLRGAVIIGADQKGLTAAFEEYAPQVRVKNVRGDGEVDQWMDNVVRACHELSRPGDTVLLAPASASWDQFDSYSQRGDAFTRAVIRNAESARTR